MHVSCGTVVDPVSLRRLSPQSALIGFFVPTVTLTLDTTYGNAAYPGIFELSSERPGLGITLSDDCLAEHGFELNIPPLGSSSL
eukprot:COSAG02_NODE_907_length_16005_cov_3.219252_5_plen_84_part_00